MKKISLAMLVFSSIFISQIYAQNKNVFGIVVGTNYSNLTEFNGKTRIGITGGLYWNYKFSDKFSLQTNILYLECGERENGDQTNLKLNYLNMPIMLKYELTRNMNISTGINWDMLMSVNGDGFNKDNFKKNDWGIPLSIGYLLTKNIEVGASYNIGISNIFKDSSNNTKRNWGSITLSYLFR